MWRSEAVCMVCLLVFLFWVTSPSPPPSEQKPGVFSPWVTQRPQCTFWESVELLWNFAAASPLPGTFKYQRGPGEGGDWFGQGRAGLSISVAVS